MTGFEDRMFVPLLMSWSPLIKRMLVPALMLGLTACSGSVDDLGINPKANAPIPRKLTNKMKAYGMRASSPIMIRIFKDENVLEVWKEKDTKRYGLLASYEICKWSGKFGPKFKEGDRQAPEGFYHVANHQMNPRSKYHLAFNMGFPNSYDRAHGRTGAHLMIHGACSSAGCYSMTDDRVEEIYALARESLRGGQKKFQIQAYPFRLTAKNMVKHRTSKHFPFWKMLKQGYDHFEITRVPPKVNVCNRAYQFNTISGRNYQSTAACPPMRVPQSLALAYTKKQNDYALRFEKLLARSEGRSIAALTPMTPTEALPGISVETPKTVKPVVEAPVEPTVEAPAVQSGPTQPTASAAPAAATQTVPDQNPTASTSGTKPKASVLY